MPRKSSFLMGFETGSNVYSRGFNKAQSVSQKALQARQMRISEDAAKQRKRRLEQEIKEAEFQARQRNVEQQNLLTAQNAKAAFLTEVRSLDLKKPENWLKAQKAMDRAVDAGLDKHERTYETVKTMMERFQQREGAKLHQQAQSDRIAHQGIDQALLREFEKKKRAAILTANDNLGTSWNPSNAEDQKESKTWMDKLNGYALKLSMGRIDRNDEEMFQTLSSFPGDIDKVSALLDAAHDKREYTLAEDARKLAESQRAKKEIISHTATEARLSEIEKQKLGMLPADKRKELLKLYTEARKTPEVASAIDVNNKYLQLKNIVDKAATLDSGIGDIAIVQLLYKALDPRSAVLQGEQEGAADAAGKIAKITMSVESWTSGKKLDQQTREDFLSVARWARNRALTQGHRTVEGFSQRTAHLLGARDEFESVRWEIGFGNWEYKTKGDYEKAVREGSISAGDTYTHPDPKNPGGTIRGTYFPTEGKPATTTTPKPSTTPEPQGRVFEGEEERDAAIADGSLAVGASYNFRRPDGSIGQAWATPDGKPPAPVSEPSAPMQQTDPAFTPAPKHEVPAGTHGGKAHGETTPQAPPKGVEGGMVAEPYATGEPAPATPTEDTLPPAEPGELPPTPEPGGEGPPNQGAPDLPTEPIPGLPGDKTMSRKEAFRKRRQRLSLKPIIDKIGASELDTGDGMIRIGATDESGVMITRDGKDELMSWDDFEELMDKLGYLK